VVKSDEKFDPTGTTNVYFIGGNVLDIFPPITVKLKPSILGQETINICLPHRYFPKHTFSNQKNYVGPHIDLRQVQCLGRVSQVPKLLPWAILCYIISRSWRLQQGSHEINNEVLMPPMGAQNARSPRFLSNDPWKL